MSVLASASITLTQITDIEASYRFYLLQSSSSNPPSKPTSAQAAAFIQNGTLPGNWVLSEPSYTEGSTNSLYTIELTAFSDDTGTWSEVSLSSSYEAAKSAYNKAVAAQNAANNAEKVATNYITEVTSDGMFVHRDDSGHDGDQPTDNDAYGVHITDSVDIIRAGKSVASYGQSARIGTDGAEHILISAGNTKFYSKDGDAVAEIISSSNDEAYVSQDITINASQGRGQAYLSSGIILSSTKPVSVSFHFEYGGNPWTAYLTIPDMGSSPSTNIIANDVVIGSLTGSVGLVIIDRTRVNISLNFNTSVQIDNVVAYCQYYTDASRPYFRFGNLSETVTAVPGKYSFSTGNSCVASGISSFAEGDKSIAAGDNSHAGGIFTNASGIASFAYGMNLIANGDYQTVIGRYNSPDNTSAFIIGNGSSSIGGLKNAFTVDWDGVTECSGGVHGPFIQATGTGSITCGTSPTIINLRNGLGQGDIYYNPSGTFSITGGTPSGVMINKPGIYRIFGSVNITPTSSTSRIGCYIGNNTSSTYVGTIMNVSGTSVHEINCGPKLIKITSSTTIYLMGRNGTANADSVNTYLLVERVS